MQTIPFKAADVAETQLQWDLSVTAKAGYLEIPSDRRPRLFS